jgi:hypothetical protein
MSENGIIICDYYAEAIAAQNTEGAMKILFLATAAFLVLSLSSNAQDQRFKHSDAFCGPYCAKYCAAYITHHNQTLQKCLSKCMPMCRESGH